jgi:hypothetical protein
MAAHQEKQPHTTHISTGTYVEHLDALLEGDAQRGAQVLERLHGVLLRDQVQLVLVLVGDAVEDVREQSAHYLQT